MGIKVNDQLGSYFPTKKGLRQGDPLSPILSNIVVDMLAILISRAKESGKVEEVIPHLMEGCLSILQYADDTTFFMDMKLILCTFEQLSYPKINSHKSEIFCFGQAKECEAQYAHLFGCKARSLPFRYLGIPMSCKKAKQ
jgi:hypothetical protein